MKLNIMGCRAYAERKGIKDYEELAEDLGLDVLAILELEQGNQIGYEAVKEIYNKLGEKVVLQIIDFEGETLNGFKSKYVQMGDKLY